MKILEDIKELFDLKEDEMFLMVAGNDLNRIIASKDEMLIVVKLKTIERLLDKTKELKQITKKVEEITKPQILERNCYWCGKPLVEGMACDCEKAVDYEKQFKRVCFEEEFPSLKGKEHSGWVRIIDGMNLHGFNLTKEGITMDFTVLKDRFEKDEEKSIRVIDTQKHCLDKQRVRDVINKKIEGYEPFNDIVTVEISKELSRLKKELGL